jgi:hypothetical protein
MSDIEIAATLLNSSLSPGIQNPERLLGSALLYRQQNASQLVGRK